MNIFDLFDNFDFIPIENLINLLKILDLNLDKSLNLTQYLNSFLTITNYNGQIIDRYNELNQSFVNILDYFNFIKEKDNLLDQKKLLKDINKINDMAEILNKLQEKKQTIQMNKKNLIYLEEDYFKEKKRYDQFKKTIENLEYRIEGLGKQRKDFFRQINKLTREMEDPTLKDPVKESNLSYSEKILALQKNIRKCQYEIKTFDEELITTRNEFVNYANKFDKLEKSYKKLLNLLDKEHKKVKEIKTEIGEKLKENFDEFDEFFLIKTPEQINIELLEIENRIESIEIRNKFLNNDQPEDLTNLQEEIAQIKNLIINTLEFKTPITEKEITQTVDCFRTIETKINSLIELVNKFLMQIYLKSTMEIIISEDNEKLSFKLSFFNIRKKIVLNFDELTTPEKIYFVIVLYISILILMNSKNIIFSNLFLPSIYNKRGSIFRTMKKILPIFGREDILKEFNLVFIISNLEMKEQIKNLKVITINKKR